MLWSSRRAFLFAGFAALGACGFEPVYAPGGVGTRLLGQIQLDAPETPDSYLFVRRFEERLGRAPSGAYQLSVDLSTSEQGLGGTSAGATTRFRVLGTADYRLTEAGGTNPVITGRTEAFTGYSTTGSTVATAQAERDAYARLMSILADQVIDRLILAADQLPQ